MNNIDINEVLTQYKWISLFSAMKPLSILSEIKVFGFKLYVLLSSKIIVHSSQQVKLVSIWECKK